MDPAKLHSREHSNPKTKFTKGKGNREEGVLNPPKKKKAIPTDPAKHSHHRAFKMEKKINIKETEKRG